MIGAHRLLTVREAECQDLLIGCIFLPLMQVVHVPGGCSCQQRGALTWN